MPKKSILIYLRKFSAVFGTKSLYKENTTLPTGLSAILISKKTKGRCAFASDVDIAAIDEERYIRVWKLDKLRNEP